VSRKKKRRKSSRPEKKAPHVPIYRNEIKTAQQRLSDQMDKDMEEQGLAHFGGSGQDVNRLAMALQMSGVTMRSRLVKCKTRVFGHRYYAPRWAIQAYAILAVGDLTNLDEAADVLRKIKELQLGDEHLNAAIRLGGRTALLELVV